MLWTYWCMLSHQLCFRGASCKTPLYKIPAFIIGPEGAHQPVDLEHCTALQPTDRKEVQQLMAGIWTSKPEVCSKNICLTHVTTHTSLVSCWVALVPVFSSYKTPLWRGAWTQLTQHWGHISPACNFRPLGATWATLVLGIVPGCPCYCGLHAVLL